MTERRELDFAFVFRFQCASEAKEMIPVEKRKILKGQSEKSRAAYMAIVLLQPRQFL